MDDFKSICIYENLLVFAYFLKKKNGRIYRVFFGGGIQHYQIYFHVPNTLLTLLNYERYVHVYIFRLYIFHLFLLSRQTSIAMWTILISKSWWWLLEPKRLRSTLHDNKFTYLDFVFLQSSYCRILIHIYFHFDIYIYIYIYISSYNVWKHVRYPALISRQPRVITQFR